MNKSIERFGKSRSALALLLALLLSFTAFVGCKGKEDSSAGSGSSGSGTVEEPVDNTTLYVNNYKTLTRVGYSMKVLDTIDRKLPGTPTTYNLSNKYPKYGETLALTDDEKAAILRENSLICAKPTTSAGGTYDKMDENGYLYLEGQPVKDEEGNQRRLFKHIAAAGMYNGDVLDSEPAIVKQVTYKNRGYSSYNVTGVYAPAGEVIKIELSDADMKSTGGITVHIGQALYNGQSNNIWMAKNFNRMPVILNTMEVNEQTATYANGKWTAYVGSFLGGPIYIRNETPTFTVTISGGVRYSHFILGYTTKEEFEENASSSAPYFDLEVWENGVLHSGPKNYSTPYDYDELYDAAIYWDKVALVSTKVTRQGIVFLYDPFVAAGAAVAFPGRSSVNCPMGWMSSSLNYAGLSTTGAWGNMHEYNHNFQSNWGRGAGTEVTNNVLNLVEYSLFTKISSVRQIENYGASGLSDWNRYTVATWADAQAIGLEKRENDLSVYAAVLHSFGPDNMIKAINHQQKKISERNSKFSVSMDGWCMALSDYLHYDFTYYFDTLVSDYKISESVKEEIKAKNYPVYVPFSCAYQTGVSYETENGHKARATTMKPYQIEQGQPFSFDLDKFTVQGGQYSSGSVVVPNGFTYTIKSYTEPKSGTLTREKDTNKFQYVPGNEEYSGDIKFTLNLKNEAIGYDKDVDIYVEFQQTHDLNKFTTNRTVYYYDTLPESAAAAFESNYKDAKSNSGKQDNLNPKRANGSVIQDSNTDVWFDKKPENQVIEISGKLYADDAAEYRLALRGRYDCAVFVSTDGEHYEKAAEYKNPGTNPAFPNTEGTYKDFNLKAGTWLYFKEVLKVAPTTNFYAFVGLGWGKYTPAVPKLDNDGNIVGELTPKSVTVKYAAAYRSTYEFPASGFEADYFYKNDYNYDYENVKEFASSDLKIAETNGNEEALNYQSWDGSSTFDIGNLVDGKLDTNIHTKNGVLIKGENGKPDHPWNITIDLGSAKEINEATFYVYSKAQGGSNRGMPTDFTIYSSDDLVNFKEVQSYTNQTTSAASLTVYFPTVKARYIKLHFTDTDNHRYLALSEVKFRKGDYIRGGTLLSPDDERFVFKGRWSNVGTIAAFGHAMYGKKGSIVEFDFEGERLAVLTVEELGTKIKVEIDGKVVTGLLGIKGAEDGTAVSFLSDILGGSAKHHVKITCVSDVGIDSVVIWPKAQ